MHSADLPPRIAIHDKLARIGTNAGVKYEKVRTKLQIQRRIYSKRYGVTVPNTVSVLFGPVLTFHGSDLLEVEQPTMKYYML